MFPTSGISLYASMMPVPFQDPVWKVSSLRQPWVGAMSDAKPLQSRVWSCSELVKGAQISADLAGMDLKYDAGIMSREQLVRAIQAHTYVVHEKHAHARAGTCGHTCTAC